MTYTAKAAVCSEIRTKHSTLREDHVEFFNIKPDGSKETARLLKVKDQLTLERLQGKSLSLPTPNSC
jgi:hypothetical protein